MKSLSTRRTDVSDELLNRLLTAAARTQTMGNLQLYSVVITRSNEMKSKLAPAHFNQPMVTNAPVVLTICADFNRTSQWARCFLIFHQCCHRRITLHSDLLQPCRRRRVRLLLPWDNGLYASTDHRYPPASKTRHARRHTDCRLAR